MAEIVHLHAEAERSTGPPPAVVPAAFASRPLEIHLHLHYDPSGPLVLAPAAPPRAPASVPSHASRVTREAIEAEGETRPHTFPVPLRPRVRGLLRRKVAEALMVILISGLLGLAILSAFDRAERQGFERRAALPSAQEMYEKILGYFERDEARETDDSARM